MNDKVKLPGYMASRTPISIWLALALGVAAGSLLIRSNFPALHSLYFAMVGVVLVCGALCPFATKNFFLVGYAYAGGVAGSATLWALLLPGIRSAPEDWWRPILFFVVIFFLVGLVSLLPSLLWLLLKPDERTAREHLKWVDGQLIRVDSRRTHWFMAAGVHFVLCILGIGATHWMLPKVPMDSFPDYRPVDYDWRLTERAKTAPALISALAQFHRDHSRYPEDWEQLLPYLPPSSETTLPHIAGWHYWKHPDNAGYTISRKLGWDAGLQYHFDGSQGHWVFEPGDGTESTRIILDP